MIKLLDRNSFNKIANILVDAYGKSETYKSLEDLTREYEERLGLDSENAFEEVVADCMTSMLTSTNAAETIAKLRSTMNEKAQKSFINTINNAIKTVRNFLSNKPKKNLIEASRITNQLNALEKIADIWASGVANSMNEYERIAKSDNEGKASANEVVRDSKKRYNKTYTDEFRTNAMIWANSSTTQVGDTKILNNKGKNFVLIEATENGYVEIESGSYDALKGAKEYYETTNKARKILDRYAESLENERGRDDWSFSVIENATDEGRTVGLDSGKSNSNQQRNNERSRGNSQKFSTKLNSEGEALSEGQAEYFKDSKVRDADGNLLKVYHGTFEDFTVFDRTKGRHNMDIQGSFFSPWELDAQGYGTNVKAYYLNITNPASEQMGYKALRMFQGQNNAGIKAREYLESLGYDGVNNGNEEYIAFNSNQIKLVDNLNPTNNEDVRYSNKIGETKDATQLTEEDFAYLLEQVQNGAFDDNTYIPIRRNTPNILKEVVERHSKGTVQVHDLPIISTVEHIAQNMEEDDGIASKNKRGHGLDVEDMISISKEMNTPIYIVYQPKFNRYAEIVSFYNKRNKKVVASIDFADYGTKQNYKHSQYMNGYNGGYYNVVVTEFEPDSLEKFLSNNEIVYDKTKTNGQNPVGSGHHSSVTQDNNPFVDNKVPQPTDNVKSKDSTKLTPEEYARQIKTLEKENNLLVEDNKYLKELVSIQGKLKVYQNAKEAMHHTHHIQIMNFVFDESDIDKLYQAIMQV